MSQPQLERKSLWKGHVVPLGFHKRKDLPYSMKSYVEWYDKDLESIAKTVGSSVGRIKRDLTSHDPLRRFHAYYDIGSYWGFDNFDSSPLDMSERALEKRISDHPYTRRVR